MIPIYISIQQEATGRRIKELMQRNGYSVRDVQTAMGFENPQAVYKWISGRSLPSIDSLLVLSVILHASIEDILVVDGDVAIFEIIPVRIVVLAAGCALALLIYFLSASLQ